MGFSYFKLDDGTFSHSTALIAISPKGKIARILPGSTSQRNISFLPVELKMAVMEASQGKVSATAARILRYCFSFEPEGYTLTLSILRVMGVLITLTGVGFFIYLVKKNLQKFLIELLIKLKVSIEYFMILLQNHREQ